MRTRKVLLSMITVLLIGSNLTAETDSEKAKDLYYDSANSYALDDNGTLKVETTNSSNRLLNSYIREVAYEKIKKDQERRQRYSITAGSNKELVFDTVAYQDKLKAKRKAEENARKKKEEKEKEKRKYIHLTGYCIEPNDIEIDRIKEYTYANCEFGSTKIPRGRLMISLTPIPNHHAVIGTPIYLDPGESEIDNIMFDVDRGVVMTLDKTSINLANFYNDVLAKHTITEAMMKTGDVAAQQAIAYLEDEKQSRQRSQINYVNGSVGAPAQPIVTQDTARPDPELYLLTGGVQLASALVNVIGQAFLDNIHYMFKIYKGAQFYVDIVVHEKTEDDYAEKYQDQGKTPNVQKIQTTRGFEAVPSENENAGGAYYPSSGVSGGRMNRSSSYNRTSNTQPAVSVNPTVNIQR